MNPRRDEITTQHQAREGDNPHMETQDHRAPFVHQGVANTGS
jgi:hypothetical protein